MTLLAFGLLLLGSLAALAPISVSPALGFSWSRPGGAAADPAYRLSGLLPASVGPRIEIEGGQIRFADQQQSIDAGALGAGSLLDLTAAWLGSLAGLSIKGLVIDRPTLALHLGSVNPAPDTGTATAQATGQLSSENFALALLPALKAIGRFKLESLKVVNGRIRIIRADGTEEMVSEFNAELRTGSSGQILSGKGEFVLRGQKLDFAGSLGKPVGVGSSTDEFPLALQVSSALLSTSFDGRLSIADGLQQAGRIAVATPDLKALANWLGQAMPESGGFGPLKIDSDFKWTGNRMTFEEARIALDGNSAFGTLTVDISQLRSAVDGTLAFETLDLSPYQSMIGQGGLASRINGLIDTDWLQFVDADLRISAADVIFGTTRAGRMAASVSLTAGTLLGDLVELEAFEGIASGQFELEPSPTGVRMALRGRFVGGDLQVCSKLLLGDRLIAGVGTLSVDLSGRGDSFAPLLRSLRGQIALDIPSSGRIGVDLARLMELAPGKRLTGWTDYRAEMSRFDALQAVVKIEGGRATGENMHIKLGSKELSAGGSVDLTQQRLDLKLQLGDGKTASGDAKTPPASRTAVILEGAWNAPSIFVE